LREIEFVPIPNDCKASEYSEPRFAAKSLDLNMKEVNEIKKAKINLINSDCGNQWMRIIAKIIPGMYRENHSSEEIISEKTDFCRIIGKRI